MRKDIGIPLLLVIGVACSQRVSTEEEFARSERDRPVVSAEGVRLPTPVGTPGGGMPGSAGMGAPAGEVDADDEAQTIRGTIAAPSGAGGGVLFLFVRAAGATGGPPLAVQRIPSPSFPLSFAIGPADAMMAGGPFPDRVTVEARLDADGNAMTEGPDDVSARAEVAPGASGVELTLGP
ncbi:MAG TPA: hypothetical protein VFQ21_02455 [Gemmatimonadota bacterium]|nr:hypothetical protein [Gemmatimonadota bacterium]